MNNLKALARKVRARVKQLEDSHRKLTACAKEMEYRAEKVQTEGYRAQDRLQGIEDKIRRKEENQLMTKHVVPNDVCTALKLAEGYRAVSYALSTLTPRDGTLRIRLNCRTPFPSLAIVDGYNWGGKIPASMVFEALNTWKKSLAAALRKRGINPKAALRDPGKWPTETIPDRK